MGLDVYIFSFNRGILLHHALLSALKVLPFDNITIVDDGSTDPMTVDLLSSAAALGVRVFNAAKERRIQGGSRGGLRANMQLVINEIARGGQLALFMQDDMQFVRHISADDIAWLNSKISEDGDGAFVAPYFLIWDSETAARKVELADGHYHFTHSMRGMTDVVVANIDRLRNARFSYAEDEKNSSQRAISVFGPMAVSPYPFVAFLPCPRSYRFGYRPLSHKLWEYFTTGFFPFTFMTRDDVSALFGRSMKELPLARNWLRMENAAPAGRWKYMGISEAPKTVRAVAKAERVLFEAINLKTAVVGSSVAGRKRKTNSRNSTSS
jgi:hypothetical protein